MSYRPIGTLIQKIESFLEQKARDQEDGVGTTYHAASLCAKRTTFGEALEAMKTVDIEQVAPLMNPETTGEIIDMATQVRRMDVIERAITVAKDPKWMLTCDVVLKHDKCFDVLMQRFTPHDLNEREDRAYTMAVWETVIDFDDQIAEERYLQVMFPKLHAAGADLMDNRFEGFETSKSPGRRALATYRRRVLAAELHALAEAETPEPALSRARARL